MKDEPFLEKLPRGWPYGAELRNRYIPQESSFRAFRLDKPSLENPSSQMMKWFVIGTVSLAVLGSWLSEAWAEVVVYEADFMGTANSNVTAFNGSIGFTFDDSAINGVGSEIVRASTSLDLSIDSFSISPEPWGKTTFGPSNIDVELRFLDGNFYEAIFGASEPASIYAGSDDFLFSFNLFGDTSLFNTQMLVGDASTSISSIFSIGSGSVTLDARTPLAAVPEPTEIWTGVALLAWSFMRRICSKKKGL